MYNTEVELVNMLGVLASCSVEELTRANEKVGLTTLPEGNEGYISIVVVSGEPWIQLYENAVETDASLIMPFEPGRIGLIATTIATYLDNNRY